MSNLGFVQMVRGIDQLHEEYDPNSAFPILQTGDTHGHALRVRTCKQISR